MSLGLSKGNCANDSDFDIKLCLGTVDVERANESYIDKPIFINIAPRSTVLFIKPRNFNSAFSKPECHLKIGIVVGKGCT